jgi:hypothetical protein
VDPALLAELAARDERRFKGSFTLVSDHLYVEIGGEMREAPLTRAGY